MMFLKNILQVGVRVLPIFSVIAFFPVYSADEDGQDKLILSQAKSLGLQANSISDLTKITHVDLSYKKIDGHSPHLRANAFFSYMFPFVREINLSCNTLGVEGSRVIGLGKFPFLETLRLDANNITDDGVQYIVSGKFPSLLLLSLISNSITDRGCESLTEGKASKKNSFPAIKKINLSNFAGWHTRENTNSVNDGPALSLANSFPRLLVHYSLSGKDTYYEAKGN